MRNSKVRTTLHWILSCVNVTLSRCSPARADGRALYEDTLLILKILLCGALVVSIGAGILLWRSTASAQALADAGTCPQTRLGLLPLGACPCND